MIQSETCLSDSSWEKMKPLGMITQFISRKTLEGEEFEEIKLSLIHIRAGKRAIIEFCIPKFNGNVIRWRNSKKALMYIANILIDSDFDIAMFMKEESERMDIEITSPNQIAIIKIEEAITHAMRNWFYNVEPNFNPHSIQSNIDQWFSSGEEWRVLKISTIAQEDQHNGIIFKTKVPVSTHIERLLVKVFNPNLWNLLDLNSTSFSDKANESFRFVVGVTMENGILKKADDKKPVCHILDKHAIFLEMNPRRAYLLRNTFEQVIDLIKPEDPTVTPYKEDDRNKLHGINFITAVMHLEHYTHEDSIAISESAASKMIASRVITQLVESDKVVLPKVSVGSSVTPDTVIAIDGEAEVISNKLYMPGIVEEIVISKGKRFGISTNRCWFKFRSFYPLATGDKLSNRHGGKGVIYVLPDSMFPYYNNNMDIIRTEVCIGPETIINRKAMSIYKEMMLSKYCEQQEIQSIAVPSGLRDIHVYNNTNANIYDIDFTELAKRYGSKTQLFLNGEKLPEETFVAKLFWLRLDKIAREIVSCVKTRRRKSSFGGVIDKAKISGQRCNVAKLLALSGRNNQKLVEHIIKDNSSAHEFFTELVKAAQNKEFLEN